MTKGFLFRTPLEAIKNVLTIKNRNPQVDLAFREFDNQLWMIEILNGEIKENSFNKKINGYAFNNPLEASKFVLHFKNHNPRSNLAFHEFEDVKAWIVEIL